LVIKEIHLFEITIFKQVIQNLLVRSNFVLRFIFPDFYSLRPLGDWAPFLRHPCITILHQIIIEVMFTSLPVPFFREFIFKTNLMKNQGTSFFKFEINSRSSGRRLSHIKKMLILSVTNRIIMKITVWLIPT
jgi:hypothetical protein